DDLVNLKNSIAGGDVLHELVGALQRVFPTRKLELTVQPYSLKLGGVDCRRLSTGERTMFDLALRVQAARITRAGLLAFDNRNHVDDPTFGTLAPIDNSGLQVLQCKTTSGIGLEVKSVG